MARAPRQPGGLTVGPRTALQSGVARLRCSLLPVESWRNFAKETVKKAGSLKGWGDANYKPAAL